MQIGPLVNTDLLAVGPSHSLAEVARRMAARRVGSAVVNTEDGTPGIITERDMLRAIAQGEDLESTPVEKYMSANAITASPSWDVSEAARRMKDGGFRHLIVLGDNGRPAGMLSVRDLVYALLDDTSR